MLLIYAFVVITNYSLCTDCARQSLLMRLENVPIAPGNMELPFGDYFLEKKI